MAIDPTPNKASAGRSSWKFVITYPIVDKNPELPELP